MAAIVGAETGAELASEDVDEQQQEHDRHRDEHHGQRGVAELVFEVATQHHSRVAQGVGERGHDCSTPNGAGSSGMVAVLPVTAKKHVVKVGGVDREALDIDGGLVQLVQEFAQ